METIEYKENDISESCSEMALVGSDNLFACLFFKSRNKSYV